MREIKFRGYDDNRRRWCCGMLFIVFCKYARILRPDGDYYSVEPDSVGQYTGFSDAQGNEIYEGDIISFPDWVSDEYGDFVPVKNIARVIFNTVSGAWEIEDPLHRRGSISPMLSLLPRDGLKVIGNMFENAEMLKMEETLDYSAADIAELKETIKEQDALLKRQGVELDDASMELSELKDKLRWRKQSEEPAPTGANVLIRYLDYDGIKMRIACMEDMLDPDGEPCYADICWRPLDLPEERKQ